MKYIKDTKEIIPNFEVKTDPFGDNVSGEHAYKRAERIVSAVYLVTNHVRFDDPLRIRIRSIGHDLLNEVLALHGGFRAATHERLSSLLALVRECISLTRLLHLAGYVSDQNGTILTNALDELGQFLSGSQRSALSDGIQLSRDDFIPAQAQALGGDRLPIAPSVRAPRLGIREAQRGVANTREEQKPKQVVRPPGRSVQTEVHGERRRMILHLLGRGQRLGIKDIASQMVGCSEKTVQREVSALVHDKIVLKEGEKRWSSYRLANT